LCLTASLGCLLLYCVSFIVFCLLYFIASLKAIGPSQLIFVRVGEDIQLTCYLYPKTNAQSMEVRWVQSHHYPAVYVYADREHVTEEQMAEYRGRTVLVSDAINEGKLTLQIHNATTSDNGQYQCLFEKDDVYQKASLDLKIVGLGSVPLIHMTGPEDGGIRVLCSANGWFPKPRVRWSDTMGVKLQSFSESHTQNEDGLFHVEASLVVTDSSLGNVTCSIQNPLSGQEKVSAIFLPEPFFPRMSPWKPALAGTVPVLVLLLIGISYIGWKEHQAKEREIKKRKKESQERDQMKNEKELALKARGKLGQQDKSEVSLAQQLSEIYNVGLYLTFSLLPATVTINQEIFHQNNSDPKRKENVKEETQDLSFRDRQEDCNLITLNQEGFTSGKHYWEVDLTDTDEWTLGIYETPTGSSGLPKDLQNKKFRVLEKKGHEYRALSYISENICFQMDLLIKWYLQKIVIFLDYDDNDISFYDMTEGTHIFSFTQDSFSGSLYPYFNFKSMK
ncbi:BTNL1 protein, partial [Crocuta crocuta]